MKTQIKIFLAALSFFTRIPVTYELKTEHFTEAVKYLPLIGYITGFVWGGMTWLLLQFLPFSFAVIAGIFLTVLLTGAIHEDGFADLCDGFGGGYNREAVIRIMKDSSTGVFGSIGLIFIFLSRYSLISSFSDINLIIYIVTASVISRIMPVIISSFLTYAHLTESKSSPVTGKLPLHAKILALISPAPLCFFIHPLLVVSLLLIILFTSFPLIFYFKKRINGYTGDTLGASIVIAEILVLILSPLIYGVI